MLVNTAFIATAGSSAALSSDRGDSAQGAGPTLEAVEFATLACIDWFKTRRLLGPIGYTPPAEYEAHTREQAAVA